MTRRADDDTPAPRTHPESPSGIIRASEEYRREAHRVAAIVQAWGRDQPAPHLGAARLAHQLRAVGARLYRWGGVEPRTGQQRSEDLADLARLMDAARELGVRL